MKLIRRLFQLLMNQFICVFALHISTQLIGEIKNLNYFLQFSILTENSIASNDIIAKIEAWTEKKPEKGEEITRTLFTWSSHLNGKVFVWLLLRENDFEMCNFEMKQLPINFNRCSENNLTLCRVWEAFTWLRFEQEVFHRFS